MDRIKWIRQKLVFLFLSYLRFFARLKLRQIRPIVVGITGSAGKTSTMYATAAILKDHFRIKVSINANSETGIPLNILDIKLNDYRMMDWFKVLFLCPIKLFTNFEKYDLYIVEMGIDSPNAPKNMEYLLSIIQPKIGVFLNALPVHGKYFDHLVPEQITTPEERRQAITDFIAAEKAKLITALPSDGFAILNIDDDRVKMWKEKTKAKVITVSARTYAQIQAKAFQINQSGIAMEVKEGKKSASLVLQQYLDESYANTLLCAIAVGRALDVSLENCVHSLKTNFHTPPGRMNLLAGIKHTTIIDSSYNASRQTTMNALELLNQIAKKRRVAILGDMLEMGEISRLEHEQVAEVANDCTDLVITVGEMMGNYFIPKLLSFGYPRANCVSFLNTYELAEKIKGFINQEDTILVKGSQNGLYLEVIVQALMLNKTQADSLLCRRGGFWDKKREKLNASYLSSV